MDACRVFIVGDSLFAETLNQMLVNSGTVVVTGSAPTPEEALPLIQREAPDVVIVVDTGETSHTTFGPFLATLPELPIIRADLSHDDVQVITSRSVGARRSDLLAVLKSLPRRR